MQQIEAIKQIGNRSGQHEWKPHSVDRADGAGAVPGCHGNQRRAESYAEVYKGCAESAENGQHQTGRCIFALLAGSFPHYALAQPAGNSANRHSKKDRRDAQQQCMSSGSVELVLMQAQHGNERANRGRGAQHKRESQSNSNGINGYAEEDLRKAPAYSKAHHGQ